MRFFNFLFGSTARRIVSGIVTAFAVIAILSAVCIKGCTSAPAPGTGPTASAAAGDKRPPAARSDCDAPPAPRPDTCGPDTSSDKKRRRDLERAADDEEKELQRRDKIEYLKKRISVTKESLSLMELNVNQSPKPGIRIVRREEVRRFKKGLDRLNDQLEELEMKGK